MKVNRKSAPKMVVRPHFVSDYQRLEREERTRERTKFTIAMMVAWFAAMVLIELVIR